MNRQIIKFICDLRNERLELQRENYNDKRNIEMNEKKIKEIEEALSIFPEISEKELAEYKGYPFGDDE